MLPPSDRLDENRRMCAYCPVCSLVSCVRSSGEVCLCGVEMRRRGEQSVGLVALRRECWTIVAADTACLAPASDLAAAAAAALCRSVGTRRSVKVSRNRRRNGERGGGRAAMSLFDDVSVCCSEVPDQLSALLFWHCILATLSRRSPVRPGRWFKAPVISSTELPLMQPSQWIPLLHMMDGSPAQARPDNGFLTPSASRSDLYTK